MLAARRRRPIRHLAVMVGVALCVFFQSMVFVRHAVAMASGVEVCSANGTQRVGADGKAVPDALGHGSDCGCCGVAWGGPPARAEGPLRWAVARGPAAVLSAGRLGAQWLSPLSRGPPASNGR